MDQAVSDMRRDLAGLIRRGLAGDGAYKELDWPAYEADRSASTAAQALDEFSKERHRGRLDSDTAAYWSQELIRMAERLEAGEPLDADQLAGWKGYDITAPVVVVVLVAAGYLLWRLVT